MVVRMTIGRRVPKGWFSKAISRTVGYLTFQENMWMLIGMAFKMSKQECEHDEPNIKFVICPLIEKDKDPKWQWEWKIIEITNPISRVEEKIYYDKLNAFFESTSAIKHALEKDFEGKADLSHLPQDGGVLSAEKFRKAKDAGYGVLGNMSIANKLHDAGIITYLDPLDVDKTEKIDRFAEPVKDETVSPNISDPVEKDVAETPIILESPKIENS